MLVSIVSSGPHMSLTHTTTWSQTEPDPLRVHANDHWAQSDLLLETVNSWGRAPPVAQARCERSAASLAETLTVR